MTDYMTVGEVAKALGVAPDTVRWWTRTGRLDALRTESGVRFFRRSDVERASETRKATRPRGRRTAL